MKNLFRMLALTLAISLMLSFSVFAFTDDASIGINYVDDVNMLVQLGVINGYPDGSFGPQNYITRAEFAKMAYTLKYGSDNDGNLFAGQPSVFADVANDYWAVGYINYCANQKIVSGVSANKFNPNGNITVAEATKMILVIMGCDPVKEGFLGTGWTANVVAKAIDLGIYEGWAGDPTAYATRELVAKFMRNAIFSPVYKYSAITGAGSQLNALATDYNETLGEEVMGLKSVEGIVVANERYAIDKDIEGNEFELVNGVISATGDENESMIYYEAKEFNGDINGYVITIDRGLPDEMLGNKVNVFFRADVNSSAEYNYKNVEVIGDVLVNSDTVAYTVPASMIEIYPNADSNSKTEIQPYIEFEVDGKTIQIKADKKNVDKIAKSEDAKEYEAVKAEYAKYGYEFYGANTNDYVGDIKEADINFIEDMGDNKLVDYRFVSVDGGKTYSYIFKSHEASYNAITSMNKGTVRISGFGSIDEEDAIIDGSIGNDDLVVCGFANGKVIVNKVDTIRGSVENYGDDTVYLNGSEYKAWIDCEQVDAAQTIIDYFMDNKRVANDDRTTYYVYNNLILEIDADTTVGSASDYAVILKSTYDEDMDVAYVKLGFADNTDAMLQVNKTYLENRREPHSAANDGNRPSDFANNAYVGYVVEYKLVNGGVDLSAQDMNDVVVYATNNGKDGDEKVEYNAPVIDNGQLNGLYGYNEASVLFVIKGDGNTVDHKAYKLADIDELEGLGAITDKIYGSYVAQELGRSSYVVAAAVKGDDMKISYNDSKDIAYVVKATQRYNSDTDLYYLELDMITADGNVSVTTIEDVQDFTGNAILENGVLGRLTDWYGQLVNYETNGELITKIDFVDEDKYFDAIVINERNGIVSYIEPNGSEIIVKDANIKSLSFHEDGYDIIGIDEEDYIGETLTKVSSRADTVEYRNAIIVINEGDIETIFSFAD